MPRFNTEAIVLKSFKFKDTDKIYTLFSKDKGKIGALAIGVRKINSRRSGNLDTLNYINVQISEGPGNLNYISEVKTIEAYKNIKADYTLAKNAFYILELIDKSLREDEDAQGIFTLLINTLNRLDSEEIDDEKLLKYMSGFELLLMKKLGYSPPSAFLRVLREYTISRDYISADKLIKQYVQECLGEKFNSLKI